MRDINFRIWNEHRMIHPDNEYDMELAYNRTVGWVVWDTVKKQQIAGQYDEPKGALMQFTGLKDKNGNKIYEGDIVKWNDGWTDKPSWRVAIVKFYQGTTNYIIVENTMHELTAEKDHVFSQGGFAYHRTYKHLIVCGNIYQNPELLIDADYVKDVFENKEFDI